VQEFDYIIVGGGSAGCVLAARLSENAVQKVLLVESGHMDNDSFIHIPAAFFKVIDKGRDVHFYSSEPEPGLNGQPNIVPQGNVIGGGSSINAMIYIRGHRNDYDGWAANGLPNWSWDKVFPVYKALENNQRLSNEFHGVNGALHVSDRRYGHPLSWAFVRAAQEAGLPYNDDFNGAQQTGVGFYQVTTHEGRRWSSAQAFLRAAQNRPNLTILTQTRVAKVLLEGTANHKKAVGIQLENGTKYHASREVILCAGGIATPKLLQLSGIGEAAHLRSHGIEVMADLPGVGENYQDHLEATVQAEVNIPSLYKQDKGVQAANHMLQYQTGKTGLLTSNVVECGGFVDTTGADGQPDVQFHVIASFMGFGKRQPTPGHGISISPCFLRPKSRGNIKLRSANPQDPALLHANALAHDDDVETLVRAIELSIKITEMPSLAKLVVRRVLPAPGIEKDPKALRNYVRDISKTVFHPSGTAKMGRADDRMAVVGEDLKVHGVQGLRVADASIMPTLVSGNTNAPCIMIGERASRFILGGHDK